MMQPNTDNATPMRRMRMGDELRKERRRQRERKPLDGRTRTQRRIRALTAAYLAALGGTASPEFRDRCERAAQLVAIAEETRCKALSGGVDLDDLVRVENASDRAVRALGPDRKREPAGETTGAAEMTNSYLKRRLTKLEAKEKIVQQHSYEFWLSAGDGFVINGEGIKMRQEEFDTAFPDAYNFRLSVDPIGGRAPTSPRRIDPPSINPPSTNGSCVAEDW